MESPRTLARIKSRFVDVVTSQTSTEGGGARQAAEELNEAMAAIRTLARARHNAAEEELLIVLEKTGATRLRKSRDAHEAAETARIVTALEHTARHWALAEEAAEEVIAALPQRGAGDAAFWREAVDLARTVKAAGDTWTPTDDFFRLPSLIAASLSPSFHGVVALAEPVTTTLPTNPEEASHVMIPPPAPGDLPAIVGGAAAGAGADEAIGGFGNHKVAGGLLDIMMTQHTMSTRTLSSDDANMSHGNATPGMSAFASQSLAGTAAVAAALSGGSKSDPRNSTINDPRQTAKSRAASHTPPLPPNGAGGAKSGGLPPTATGKKAPSPGKKQSPAAAAARERREREEKERAEAAAAAAASAAAAKALAAKKQREEADRAAAAAAAAAKPRLHEQKRRANASLWKNPTCAAYGPDRVSLTASPPNTVPAQRAIDEAAAAAALAAKEEEAAAAAAAALAAAQTTPPSLSASIARTDGRSRKAAAGGAVSAAASTTSPSGRPPAASPTTGGKATGVSHPPTPSMSTASPRIGGASNVSSGATATHDGHHSTPHHKTSKGEHHQQHSASGTDRDGPSLSSAEAYEVGRCCWLFVGFKSGMVARYSFSSITSFDAASGGTSGGASGGLQPSTTNLNGGGAGGGQGSGGAAVCEKEEECKTALPHNGGFRVEMTYVGHQYPIDQVLPFHHDGTPRLATAGADKVCRVYNIETGECTQIFSANPSQFRLAFCPWINQLVAGARDGSVSVWGPKSGFTKEVLRLPSPICCLAVSESSGAEHDHALETSLIDPSTMTALSGSSVHDPLQVGEITKANRPPPANKNKGRDVASLSTSQTATAGAAAAAALANGSALLPPEIDSPTTASSFTGSPVAPGSAGAPSGALLSALRTDVADGPSKPSVPSMHEDTTPGNNAAVSRGHDDEKVLQQDRKLPLIVAGLKNGHVVGFQIQNTSTDPSPRVLVGMRAVLVFTLIPNTVDVPCIRAPHNGVITGFRPCRSAISAVTFADATTLCVGDEHGHVAVWALGAAAHHGASAPCVAVSCRPHVDTVTCVEPLVKGRVLSTAHDATMAVVDCRAGETTAMIRRHFHKVLAAWCPAIAQAPAPPAMVHAPLVNGSAGLTANATSPNNLVANPVGSPSAPVVTNSTPLEAGDIACSAGSGTAAVGGPGQAKKDRAEESTAGQDPAAESATGMMPLGRAGSLFASLAASSAAVPGHEQSCSLPRDTVVRPEVTKLCTLAMDGDVVVWTLDHR